MPSPSTTANAALTAFLRGIERRAQVFALAQCGDEDASAQAVATTVSAFSADAETWPIGQWPAQFWTLLLQRPELVRSDAGEPVLAALSPGPRAALLLRLVAGLDFSHGAQVLAVSEPAYRYALQRGLDELHAAGHNMATLEALRESLRLRVTPERPTAGAAEPGSPLATAVPAPTPVRSSDGRWRWPQWLLGLLLLALGVSFLPPVEHWLRMQLQPARVASGTAPITLDEASALVTHPDFQLLLSPDDEALAQDLAFLSWFEAGAPAPGMAAKPAVFGRDDLRTQAPADFSQLPAPLRAVLQTIAPLWPQLDADSRTRLQANALAWESLADGEREALRGRATAWDAQATARRAQRRALHGQWRWLAEDERIALREAATLHASLSPPEQLALRDLYSSLPDKEREAWSLGPMLGRALPTLAPLFDFVPADERDALLALVRVLRPAQREQLARRLAAMPPAERERLRRKLIATPPAEVDGLIGVAAPP